MQALVQCKKMLTDLGIAKISVDDTAATAKVYEKYKFL